MENQKKSMARKILVLGCIMMLTMALAVMASATSVTAPDVDVGNIGQQIVGMFGDFSVANLLIFIGAGIGIAAGLVLTWFGVRFLTRKLMAALKKGKL